MSKIVIFAGLERCDILYHIVSILAKSKENPKIMVVDNSKTHDLYNIIERPDDFEIAMLDSAVVLKSKYVDDEFNYDYVFIYQGNNLSKANEHLYIADYVYLQTDYTPVSIQLLKAFLEEAIQNDQQLEDKQAVLIFRDNVTSKIKESMILDSMVAGVREPFVLPYDSKDYEAYISLLYNGSQKLKATPEFISVIVQILVDLTKKSDKEVKKMLK